MSGSADTSAEQTCSSSGTPGGDAEACGHASSVVELRWDKREVWCSEHVEISGRSTGIADGEMIQIEVKDHDAVEIIHSLEAQVSSNAFGAPWDVKDVLPTGGPSWSPRRNLSGVARSVVTDPALQMRFIPNVEKKRADHTAMYNRTNPGATSPTQVGVKCRFSLDSANYLLSFYGEMKYVKGWGKERLLLGDATLGGSFTAYGETSHWGYRDAGTGAWKYWDGSAWQNTPASWIPDNSNHFGIAFYKQGSNWKCRDAPGQSWPQALGEWPASQDPQPTLTTWTNQIQTVWSDRFDIKRKGCTSTRDECCRYKTRCEAAFTEVTSYGDEVIIITFENVRSDAGMWSLADSRAGLAPHEFGHLLGAPDEYAGVGTTQLGVNDSDGLANGVDANCLMGANLSDPKRRHYKGIVEVLAKLVKDELGKDYQYEAVAKAANLGSPAGTATTADPGGGGSSLGPILGAIIGAVIGAIVGAIIGFVASGGNPGGAVAGALIGATAGALAGAGIGSLF